MVHQVDGGETPNAAQLWDSAKRWRVQFEVGMRAEIPFAIGQIFPMILTQLLQDPTVMKMGQDGTFRVSSWGKQAVGAVYSNPQVSAHLFSFKLVSRGRWDRCIPCVDLYDGVCFYPCAAQTGATLQVRGMAPRLTSAFINDVSTFVTSAAGRVCVTVGGASQAAPLLTQVATDVEAALHAMLA